MTRETSDASDLRNLVRLYHVGFGARPDRVDIDGRVVEVTFQLKLRGTHDGCRGSGEIPCRACIRVLRTLFEIADVLLPIEQETLKQTGRNYEKRMRYSRGCSPRCGATLAFEIKTRRPFEQANDGWAMEFLQEVTQFLLEKGCHQVELPAETQTQTAPIDEPDRFSSRELREGDFLATRVW